MKNIESTASAGNTTLGKNIRNIRKSLNLTQEEFAESLDGRVYTTLRFCSLEALDNMIRLLQDTKKMWESDLKNKEDDHGKDD